MKNVGKSIQSYSTNINFLRFISAILVIVSHSYVLLYNETDFLYRYTNGHCSLGGLAVGIFFFLSGLYVTKSYYKRSMDDKVFWPYIKRRLFRIIPSLWIVLLIQIIVLGGFFSDKNFADFIINIDFFKYLLNFFLIPIHNLPGVFVNNYDSSVNGVLWTLPVEFVCYIITGIIGVIASKLHKKSATILRWIMAISSLILMVIVNVYFANYEAYHGILRPVCLFFVGSLFYDNADRIKGHWIIGIVALLILALAGPTMFFSYFFVLLLPIVVTFLFITTPQLPKVKGIDYVMSLSYEMYLVGFPIQQCIVAICSKNGMNLALNIIIVIVIDIVLAFDVHILEQTIVNRIRKTR